MTLTQVENACPVPPELQEFLNDHGLTRYRRGRA